MQYSSDEKDLLKMYQVIAKYVCFLRLNQNDSQIFENCQNELINTIEFSSC